MAGQPLTFIHLSDIHFNGGDKYDLDKDLRKEIIEDIKRVKNNFACILGILITGDIAFSGKKTEYDCAMIFLKELCQIIGIPETSIYCVPGNHDVDQDIIKKSHSLDRAQIAIETSSDLDSEIIGYLGDPNSSLMMFSHIHEYNNFSAKFNCNIDSDSPAWKEDLVLNDGSILRLHGLNTITISSHRDKADRKMVIGKIQIPHNENGVAFLSLCHHPPELWKDADETKRMVFARLHIQLYGHKHTQDIVKYNNSLLLFSGASHPVRSEKKWQPRYNWLSISVEGTYKTRSLKIKVYPRILNDDNNKFIADTNNCQGNSFLEHTLTLDTWEAPKPASLESQTMSSTEHKTNAVNNESRQEGQLQNPIRTLVYRFFGLSYITRSIILSELGLLLDEDEKIEHTKLFRVILQRAREKNVMSKLWDRIENSHNDNKHKTNPFL